MWLQVCNRNRSEIRDDLVQQAAHEEDVQTSFEQKKQLRMRESEIKIKILKCSIRYALKQFLKQISL